MKLTRKKGFDYHASKNQIEKLILESIKLRIAIADIHLKMQIPIPKYPKGEIVAELGPEMIMDRHNNVYPISYFERGVTVPLKDMPSQSACDIIDIADRLKDAIKDSARRVGNYQSVIQAHQRLSRSGK